MKAGLDVVGLPLVDTVGQQVGRVGDLVLDDRGRQVLGVVLERGWLRRRHRFVPLHDVHAFRRDQVVVPPHLAPATAPARATGSMTGKVAVTRSGRYLGVVEDVYFDERTGEVSAYAIGRPERPSGPGRHRIVLATACPAVADVVVVGELAT